MEELIEPTKLQSDIVSRLLQEDFPGRDELRDQFRKAKVKNLNCEDKCPSFLIIPASSAPKSKVDIRIPVEASTKDGDGGPLEVLLHVVDGLLEELEVVKYGEADFIGPINPDLLEVKVNNPKDWPNKTA